MFCRMIRIKKNQKSRLKIQNNSRFKIKVITKVKRIRIIIQKVVLGLDKAAVIFHQTAVTLNNKIFNKSKLMESKQTILSVILLLKD